MTLSQILLELQSANDCLMQYKHYGEEMREIGRGFSAVDIDGRPIELVLVGLQRAIALLKEQI